MRVLLCLTLLIGSVLAACTTRPVTSPSTPIGTSSTDSTKSSPSTIPGSSSSTEATSSTPATKSSSEGESFVNKEGDGDGDDDCTTTYSSTSSTTSQQSTTTLIPQTTTLPNVSVSVVEFSLHSCNNAVCTYTYLAPANDPVFLATEQTLIGKDNVTYINATAQVTAFNATVGQSITDATAKVDGLRKQLELAQENLNTIQYELNQLIWNTNNASSNLMAVNYYIDRYIDRSQCYFGCTLPPSTPAPTTTPTTPPTTTADRCHDGLFNCSSITNSVCQLYSNEPFCTNCSGNMDGYKKCQLSGCYPAGADATIGVFWSPGYNELDKDYNNATLDPNLSCQWNYYGSYKFNETAGSYNVSILGQTSDTPLAMLIPHDGSGPYTIYKSTNFKKLNSQIANVVDFTIQLTTPNSQQPSPSFFFWEIIGK